MEHYWTFFIFAVISCITPGPNNLMLMSSGLNFGVRRTLPHFFGVMFGFSFFFFVLGMGLSTLFTRYEYFHAVIKVLGGAYMLYLAYKVGTSHTKIAGKHLARPISFFQGVLFQWVNPKAWVIGVSSIAAYTSLSGEHLYQQVLIIVATYFFVLIPTFGFWMVFGAKLGQFLKQERHRAYFNYIMGSALALTVLFIFMP